MSWVEWSSSSPSLKNCRAGGSMVLNLYSDWKDDEKLVRANQQGWDIYVMRTLEELVPFAKAFSQSLNGQFEGVGMTIDSSNTKRGLLVRMVFDNSPAKQAGISPGDLHSVR